MPLSTSHAAGEVITAADINALAAAVNDLQTRVTTLEAGGGGDPGGGGGGGDQPPVTTGLEAFYDSAQLLGAGVALPADGTAVDSWVDMSGNGRHLVQATSGSQPTFHTGSPQPHIALDGSDDFLEYAASVPVQTVFAVARVTGGGAFAGLVTNGLDNGTPVGFVWVRDGSNDNWYTSAGQPLGAGTAYYRDGVQTTSIGVGDSTPHVYDASGTSSGSFPNSLRVGIDRNNAGRNLAAEVFAVLIYSTALTTLETSDVRAWLQTRYGTP